MYGQRDKVALFVDGANFYATLQHLGMTDVDYTAIRNHFSKREQLFRCFYFTAILPDSEPDNGSQPIFDYLAHNGWNVVTKVAKKYYDQVTKRYKIKGNMDGEMHTEIMLLKDIVQHVVIFSGDGDFCHLVRTLKILGVRVSVVSSAASTPSMISQELRKTCDQFMELADLRETFMKK